MNYALLLVMCAFKISQIQIKPQSFVQNPNLWKAMIGFGQKLLVSVRKLFELSSQSHQYHHHRQCIHDPTETLKKKIAELKRNSKRRNNGKKDQVFVEVPESKSYLDTATLPMILAAVGIALFAKLLMMVRFFSI